MTAFSTDTTAPQRRLIDICNDSPILKAAIEKQERNRSIDFYEALQLLKDAIFLRIEELKQVVAKKATDSHPEVAELRALRRYERDIETLTPQNLNTLYQAVDSHDASICTSKTIRRYDFEGEKAVTSLLLRWLNDLSRF